MLKTLRWAYNLGVKHERERIAEALRLELAYINKRRETLYNSFSPRTREPMPEDKKVERELLDKAFDLINSIYEPLPAVDKPRASIMFPEGKDD